MEIVVSGRHTEVPERFRRLAEEKLLKIGQLAPKAHRTDVELSHERNPRQSQNCEKVEITVRGKGPVIRAEASAEDPAAALDLAFGKLLERLRRHRDRRKVHKGRSASQSIRVAPADAAVDSSAGNSSGGSGGSLDGGAPVVRPDRVLPDTASAGVEGDEDAAAEAPDGNSPVVIRAKDHDAAPMTLDQALYEMELVGHDFYLFVEADSGRPSVVYRRRGWSYGVIRLRVADPAGHVAGQADAVGSADSSDVVGSVDVTDVPARSGASGLA